MIGVISVSLQSPMTYPCPLNIFKHSGWDYAFNDRHTNSSSPISPVTKPPSSQPYQHSFSSCLHPKSPSSSIHCTAISASVRIFFFFQSSLPLTITPTSGGIRQARHYRCWRGGHHLPVCLSHLCSSCVNLDRHSGSERPFQTKS